jgi:hypothetical protein
VLSLIQKSELKPRLAEIMAQAPYCANDLNDGIYRRNSKTALNKKFIEINTPADINFLVFDIDKKQQSFYSFDDCGAPIPTFITQNPINGNCHYTYALETPVHRHHGARIKPQAYCRAIVAAMTHKLGADKSYTGLITKNPLHEHWRTEYHPKVYELEELAEYVELPKNKYNHKHASESVKEGRNCALFDELRFYAYQYIKTAPASFKSVLEHLLFTAQSFNIHGLPLNEVQATAKSVAKFVCNRYSANGGSMTPEQVAGHKTQSEMAAKRRTEAFELLGRGYSQQEISEALNVDSRTLRRWIKSL